LKGYSKKIYVFLASLICFGDLYAHDKNKSADQVLSEVNSSKGFKQSEIDEQTPFAPSSPGDSDLGEQLILRRRKEDAKLKVQFSNRLIYSNNVFNEGSDEDQGFFNASSLEVKHIKKLKKNWVQVASLGQSYFTYEGDGEVDFSNLRGSFGVVNFVPKWDCVWHLDIVHDHITEGFYDSRLFNVTSLSLGVSKTMIHSRKHSTLLTLRYDDDVASSAKNLQRNELIFKARQVYRVNDKLDLALSARASQFYFDVNDREDFRINVGLSVNYEIFSEVNLSLSSLYTSNDSNQSVNDFETTAGAFGIQLSSVF